MRGALPARYPRGGRGAPVTAARAVRDIAGAARPVPLAEVVRRAELQHRYDHKYLLTPETFGRLVAALGARPDVLRIGTRRQFDYHSWYFDTPDLRTFRQHRQGRRRRYKVRTRAYPDTGECCFEIKLAERRGTTRKERIPHPIALADRIMPAGWRLLHGTLTEYGAAPCGGLAPVLCTSYRRTTLLLPDRPVRVTCDVGLVCHDGTRRVAGPDDLILVEVKSPGPYDPVTHRLAAAGIRPVRMSKYCLGVALLRPGVPANPWHRTLKRHFGWTPDSICRPSGRKNSAPAG